MDSIFGIGLGELVVILILAGLLLGPQRIRQFARQLGRLTAQLQAISRQFTRQLNAELDALDAAEVREAIQDVKDLRQQVQDLRRELSSVASEFTQESRRAAGEGETVVKETALSLNKATGQNEHRNASPSSDTSPLPTPLDVPDDPDQ